MKMLSLEDSAMPDQLILERLVFDGHIGVSDEERRKVQPIGVDLELDYPDHVLPGIAQADDISKAVDYCRVVSRVAQIGREQDYHLLETLAERLCSMLLVEFKTSRVRLWARKLQPPIKEVHGSTGVRVDRARVDSNPGPAPARFFLEHWRKLPPGDVLDVAAGYGRHTLYLAAHGFTVEALDRDSEALADLAAAARERKLPQITVRSMDLEDSGRPLDLPKERYGAVVVFYYLYRGIFPALLHALKPGGILMYETFLIDNHLRYRHPRRPEFCLGHNELLRLTSGLRVLYYDEGEHDGGHGTESAFTARLLAQKEK